MKYKLRVKLVDDLEKVINNELKERLDITNFHDASEYIIYKENLCNKLVSKCCRWFNRSKIMTVEIDTEKMTCDVVKTKKNE